MTLKEKFKNVDDEAKTWSQIYSLQEKIADEFAIGFSDWMYFKRKHNSFKLELMTKEYLEIYKKEKGL